VSVQSNALISLDVLQAHDLLLSCSQARFGLKSFRRCVSLTEHPTCGYGQNGDKPTQRQVGENGDSKKRRHGSMEVNQNGDKASLGGKMFWWRVLWWPFYK